MNIITNIITIIKADVKFVEESHNFKTQLPKERT